MKLNLQHIEIEKEYFLEKEMIISMDGTDPESYIKYTNNPLFSGLSDITENKMYWLQKERSTQRYKEYSYDDDYYLYDFYDKKNTEVQPSKGISTSIHYHGLEAYTDLNSIDDKIGPIINDDIIICGSDLPIGRIGIIFEGVVHRAFFCDVMSHKKERNSVDRNMSVSEDILYAMSKSIIGKRQYIETYSSCSKILGIWVEYFKSEKEELSVINMANKLNVHISKITIPNRIGRYKDGNELKNYLFK